MPTESVETKETRTTTRSPFEDGSSDTVRKIVAAVIGIVIIIALVLLAKWVGDRIRERYLTPKTPSPVTQVTPPDDKVIVPAPPARPTGTTAAPIGTTAPTQGTAGFAGKTVSAIPATGPNDWAYIFMAVVGVAGLSSLYLSKKLSR